MFHNGNSNNDDDFELCLRAENLYLPQFGYFGLSAATGGLAGKIFFLPLQGTLLLIIYIFLS